MGNPSLPARNQLPVKIPSLPRAVANGGAMTALVAAATVASALNPAIPATKVTTLQGQSITLPTQLPARATILIIGFGRHSQDATTAWEKPVRLGLAHAPSIDFYDMAMLAEVPSFMRSFVIGRVRKAVPDVLKPNFIPLTEDEDAWKQTAGYDADAPDAAYVLLVDRAGAVRWSSHAAFSEDVFGQLSKAAQRLADDAR